MGRLFRFQVLLGVPPAQTKVIPPFALQPQVRFRKGKILFVQSKQIDVPGHDPQQKGGAPGGPVNGIFRGFGVGGHWLDGDQGRGHDAAKLRDAADPPVDASVLFLFVLVLVQQLDVPIHNDGFLGRAQLQKRQDPPNVVQKRFVRERHHVALAFLQFVGQFINFVFVVVKGIVFTSGHRDGMMGGMKFFFLVFFLGHAFVGSTKKKSRNQMSLLSDQLIHVLLTHEIVLCGSIVREWLAGTTMNDFIAEKGIVVGRTKYSQWLTINRILFNKCAMMAVEAETANGTQALYHVHWNEQVVKVRLYFEKVKYMHFPRRDLDVNRLCFSRDGLFLPRDEFEKEPVPLARLWNQCLNKQFRLCHGPLLNDTGWKLKRVQSLLDQGWEYLDSCVHEAAAPYPDDVCAICQEPFEEDVIETSCNHSFHRMCWQQHVHSKSTTTAFSFTPLQISCPLCRESFYPWQILVPQKNIAP